MKVFNQRVLPVMTYGTQTWPLTIGLIRKLKVAQQVMKTGTHTHTHTHENTQAMVHQNTLEEH